MYVIFLVQYKLSNVIFLNIHNLYIYIIKAQKFKLLIQDPHNVAGKQTTPFNEGNVFIYVNATKHTNLCSAC